MTAPRSPIDRWMTDGALRATGFLGFFAFAVIGAATMSYAEGSTDYWQHLAAIRTLASHLLQPPPLYFSEPYEVNLYTPYHVLWGIVFRVLGSSIWHVAILMAAVNAGLFALGARLLARHLFDDADLDFVVLVTLLVFWGRPTWWSGVYSLGQLPLNVVYPSFFAMSVSMIVGALWLEETHRSAPAWLAFGIVVAILLATHPITTSFLLIFLFVKTVFLSVSARRDLILATLTVAGGCALGLLWPYYSLGTLIMAAGSGADFFGDFGAFYAELPERVGLEVLGFLGLLLLEPGRRRRFLGALLLVYLAIFVANYALHVSHIFSRYLIYTTFALQLSVVASLVSVRRQRLGRVILPAFVILAVLGGARQLRIAALTNFGLAKDLARGVALGTHSVRAQYVELERLGAVVGNGRPVVMAPLDWAYRVAALNDVEVVGVPAQVPTLPDYEGRRRDVIGFYDPESSSRKRAEIIRRRRVEYVILVADDEPVHGIVSSGWRSVLQTSRFRIYATGRE